MTVITRDLPILRFFAVLRLKRRNAFLRDRLASLTVKRESPNDQHCNHQHPDNDKVEDPSCGALNRISPLPDRDLLFALFLRA
jgi:hypothetical protein